MRCPRCLNEDPAFFCHGTAGWYCRKCISFGRAMIEEEKDPAVLAPIRENSEEYVLTYPLTEQQKMISDACMKNIVRYDVLLRCCCGAGKTEPLLNMRLHCGKMTIS